MKRTLSIQERRRLDEQVAEAEKRTGAQIVLAFVKRSDDYPELPWKAFALGAGLAGLFTTLLDLLRPSWTASPDILFTTTAVLATGASLALACVAIPAFARLFLDKHRAETEVRQYAESLFLAREVFSTATRSGVLLLVSLFERKAVILPDAGLTGRLPAEARDRIIAELAPHLAAGRVKDTLEKGLGGLEKTLGAGPAGASGNNELPDAVVEGEGA